MKKWAKRSVVWMALLGMCTLSGCASCARSCKSIQSDMDGGLNRTVTLYDYSGNEIKSWTGKFAVSESENEVYFDDEDGKRVIIHGGIVVNEEN